MFSIFVYGYHVGFVYGFCFGNIRNVSELVVECLVRFVLIYLLFVIVY